MSLPPPGGGRREEVTCVSEKELEEMGGAPAEETGNAVLQPEAEAYADVAARVYPGLAMFARDTDLPPELAAKYTPGLILREKAFTDASSRFAGMVTTHRFVILSNHMNPLPAGPGEPDTGLCTAARDARFKVLGAVTHEGKTGIFLLHLPDDDGWKLYRKAEFSIDRQLYERAVQRFRAKCVEPPAPELTTKAWLSRCAFPPGMDDDGALYPLEDAAPWEKFAPGDADCARYYRLTPELLLKHTPDEKYWLLDLFDQKWHESASMKAEFEWGNTCTYTQLRPEDAYETAPDDEEVIEILIGRSEVCGIRFRDAGVSRKHAVIYYNGKHWMLRDLGSTNGSRLNGRVIRKEELKKGDRIEIGDGTVEFWELSILIREGERSQVRRLPGPEKCAELYQGWRFTFPEEERAGEVREQYGPGTGPERRTNG